MPTLSKVASLRDGTRDNGTAARAPLHFAAAPTLLSQDGSFNTYRVNVVRDAELVSAPRTHVPTQTHTSGNVNPVARSLQVGGGSPGTVLPARPPPSTVTPRTAAAVLYDAQDMAALRFERGGPFVSSVSTDTVMRYARNHSIAGRALDTSCGPMLSDIAVQMGVLPEGPPVPYPHPHTGEPTLYLCSYLGSDLTRMWVRHVRGLVSPVGNRPHDVHRVIASAFRRMVSQAYARAAETHRADAEYAFRKQHPYLAQAHFTPDAQYERNLTAAQHSAVKTTRDRLGAPMFNVPLGDVAPHLRAAPKATVFGALPFNHARQLRRRTGVGEYVLGETA